MIQRWIGADTLYRNRWVWKIRHTEALRSFFEIDTNGIVVASISALELEGTLPSGTVKRIRKKSKQRENRQGRVITLGRVSNAFRFTFRWVHRSSRASLAYRRLPDKSQNEIREVAKEPRKWGEGLEKAWDASRIGADHFKRPQEHWPTY